VRIISFLVDGELTIVNVELVFILMNKVQILRVCKIRLVAVCFKRYSKLNFTQNHFFHQPRGAVFRGVCSQKQCKNFFIMVTSKDGNQQKYG